MTLCVTPGCARRRNGTSLHCARHNRPAPAILRAVVAVVAMEPTISYQAIAQRCAISRSTAQRALRALEDDGVITPLQRGIVGEIA